MTPAASGDIVGWFVTSDGRRCGFLLSQGQFTLIDFPGATWIDTDGINDEGGVVEDTTASMASTMLIC